MRALPAAVGLDHHALVAPRLAAEHGNASRGRRARVGHAPLRTGELRVQVGVEGGLCRASVIARAATGGERLKIAEQPYVFGTRFDGESKFNAQIGVEFLGLLLAKMTGDVVDPRFLFFAIVGTVGLVVHLVALRLSLVFMPDAFRGAQIIATLVAMTSNFLLNNELTYRDRRLKGVAMLRGFVLFCLIGSVGALTNVDLASWLYTERQVWWVAGAAGAIMGALWNYAMSTLFVWRAR